MVVQEVHRRHTQPSVVVVVVVVAAAAAAAFRHLPCPLRTQQMLPDWFLPVPSQHASSWHVSGLYVPFPVEGLDWLFFCISFVEGVGR